jgi:hypothetical protein
MDIYLTIREVAIEEVGYNIEQTRVDLIEDINTFGTHLIDSRIKLSVQYDLKLDPPILQDSGRMNMSYSDLTFQANFEPIMEGEGDDAMVMINVEDADVSINPIDVKLKLNNTNDFNQMIVKVINTVKLPIINLVARAF